MNNGYVKLRGYLAEKGIKHRDLAAEIGISQSTFSKKLNRKGLDFTLDEARKICNLFKIQADTYFRFSFNHDLPFEANEKS